LIGLVDKPDWQIGQLQGQLLVDLHWVRRLTKQRSELGSITKRPGLLWGLLLLEAESTHIWRLQSRITLILGGHLLQSIDEHVDDVRVGLGVVWCS
jgi:hypothetical protein